MSRGEILVCSRCAGRPWDATVIGRTCISCDAPGQLAPPDVAERYAQGLIAARAEQAERDAESRRLRDGARARIIADNVEGHRLEAELGLHDSGCKSDLLVALVHAVLYVGDQLAAQRPSEPAEAEPPPVPRRPTRETTEADRR